jgi:hypothetical protein
MIFGRSRLLAAAAALLLLGSASACGSSSTSDPVTAPSKPSAVGAPTGNGVIATIGRNGGRLASGDGGVTVTIPAGAVTGDVKVGIQPISNTAAGGIGSAFRLTPAAQKFAKPVRISFALTPTDLDGTAAGALGLAYQDARGFWEWTQTPPDASIKHVTMTTSHFGDWSKVAALRLRPTRATVRTGGTVALVATACVQNAAGDVIYLAEACGAISGNLAQLVTVVPGTWAVNGLGGGFPAVGTVTGANTSGVYTAPAHRVLDQAGTSVSAVSVQVDVRGKRTQLVADVTIGDGYHLVGTFRQTNSPLVCTGTVAAVVTDSIEATVTPGADGLYTVTNIKNTTTTFSGVRVPGVDIAVTVVHAPDVFRADQGTSDVLGDLITARFTGVGTVGTCSLGGPVLITGATSDARAGVTFNTGKFTSGVQKKLPSDPGTLRFTWVVTAL